MKLTTRLRNAIDVFTGKRPIFTKNDILEWGRIGKIFSNSYDAGKTGRLREDWGTSTSVPYYELFNSQKKIRARSRDLYKNDPTYRAAVNAIVNRVIGTGLKPKPRVVDTNGRAVEGINRQLERHSQRYFESVEWDAGKRHRFIGEGQRLGLKTQLISGDVILNATNAKKGSYLPIAWQMVEIDRLDDAHDKFIRTYELSKEVKQTVHGINLDENGAAVSYWFNGVEKPVSAKNVIHSYLQERPEQYVGEPLGTAILDSAYDKHEMDEDYVLKSRAVAKFLWWLSTLANTSWPNSGDQDSDGVIKMDSITSVRTQEMPDIFKMPDNVSETVEPLLRMKKHDVCSGMGISYISVLLDMSGVNFAAASMTDIKEHINMGTLREKFVASFCQPSWEKFVMALVNDGKIDGLSPSQFANDPWKYTRAEWVGNPREFADPLKTAKAKIALVDSGLRTLTEDLAERGKDVGEYIREKQKEKEMLDEAGIDMPSEKSTEDTTEATAQAVVDLIDGVK